MPFPSENLVLDNIYTGPTWDAGGEQPISCEKIDRIYGPLVFPPVPTERCYTLGCFVVSIDGRIAFPSSPDGTLVAKTNRLDPDGGLCDYWMLNLLRSACDAVIMGSLTLKREPLLSGRIYDADLLEQRVRARGHPVPLHVIVSATGNNLPLDHQLYAQNDVPTLTAVSPVGAAALSRLYPDRFIQLSPVESTAAPTELPANVCGGGRNYLVGVGSGSDLDAGLLLQVLRRVGVRRALVETPTFLASLMAHKVLDELFLNSSGIFIGGKAITIGENYPAFTPENHPHGRVVTIHAHSDSFMYTRYRFEYR